MRLLTIGLTVGLDYVSNYLYRGMYYYYGNSKNGGMFAPYAFYNICNTGLTLGIKGEVAEKWIWNSKDEKWEEKGIPSFNLNSMDFNINYMSNFKKAVILNVGVWYYLHSKETYLEVPPLDEITYDRSYFDFYISVIVNAIPFKPMLAVTYSYLTDKDYARGLGLSGWGTGPGKNGDLYVQLGIGHSFLLFEKTYLDLDAVGGFYDKNAHDVRQIATESRWTKSPDISDIDLSAGLTTTADILTFSSSFHYVIVPGTQYKHVIAGGHSRFFTDEVHRFYAKFGVSCSI